MSPRATARSIYCPPKTFFHHRRRTLLSSTLFHPLITPDYRLHNHLPPLPSEYTAGLIPPVLLRGPSLAFTSAKRSLEFVRSCPLVLLHNAPAYSGTVSVHRWLIRILHSWVRRFPAKWKSYLLGSWEQSQRGRIKCRRYFFFGIIRR